MHQVYFVRENKRIEVPEGTTVLEAQRLAGLRPDAPCGGAGTCGKCQVTIDGRRYRPARRRSGEIFRWTRPSLLPWKTPSY